MRSRYTEREVDCNICGQIDAQSTVEFGSFRGESGTIGMDMCSKCWAAAKWHSNNTTGDRCFNCADCASKSINFHQPTGPHSNGEGVDLSLCRDCYSRTGGILQTFQSDVRFRARANVSSTWERQRRMALDRDDYRCQSCGLHECRLHVHHLVPRSAGGTDHLDNLVTLCPDCHATRHDQEACCMCGGLQDVEWATWLDTSGGVGCHFCGDCISYMKRGAGGDRCVICARFASDDKRSDGIVFSQDHDGAQSMPSSHTACDQCRKTLIFDDWRTRQNYIDDELPDSHVDIRHWEVEQ